MIRQLDEFGVCAFYASNLRCAKFREVCLSIALFFHKYSSAWPVQTYMNIESDGRVFLPRPLKTSDFRL